MASDNTTEVQVDKVISALEAFADANYVEPEVNDTATAEGDANATDAAAEGARR